MNLNFSFKRQEQEHWCKTKWNNKATTTTTTTKQTNKRHCCQNLVAIETSSHTKPKYFTI